MKCFICGTENEESASVCSNCGVPLHSHEEAQAREQAKPKKRGSKSIAVILILWVVVGGLIGRIVACHNTREYEQQQQRTGSNIQLPPVREAALSEEAQESMREAQARVQEAGESFRKLQESVNNQGTEAPTDGGPSEETESARGSVSGSGYENRALGIGCTLDGWSFVSDSDIIHTIAGSDRDSISAEEFEELIGKEKFILDMEAHYPAENKNVNVQIMDYKASYGTKPTDEFVETIMEAMSGDMIVSQFERMGASNVEVATLDVTIDGKTGGAVRASFEIAGEKYCQYSVYFCSGDYVGIITTVSGSEEANEEILSHFYYLD